LSGGLFIVMTAWLRPLKNHAAMSQYTGPINAAVDGLALGETAVQPCLDINLKLRGA
jgi:hypothetical protein